MSSTRTRENRACPTSDRIEANDFCVLNRNDLGVSQLAALQLLWHHFVTFQLGFPYHKRASGDQGYIRRVFQKQITFSAVAEGIQT
jgi:hypothetical protein